MIRRHNTALRLALLAVDALSAFALFIVISMIQFGSSWAAAWRSAGFDPFAIAFVYSAVWVAALWIHDLYRLRARWSIRSEFRDVLRADLLIAVATFSALFLFKLPDVSRRFLITLFILQIVVTMASRISLRLGLGALRNRGYNRRFMLIVGTGDGARRFAERVERRRELGLMVIGHLGVAGASGEDGAVAMVGSRPVLGTVDDIEEILHTRIVDEVAICLTAEHAGLVEPITRLCEEEGRIVRIPLGELGLSLPGGRVEDFDGGLVLSLVYGPDRALALVGKRLLDIGLGGLALVVLAPVMAVVALVVRAIDGGPVIFRQTRVGLNGRPFRVTKFRTMIPDAEVRLEDLQAQNEIRGPAFKVTNDPRMTRTGRLLRATSLDELPQIWNVLLGEMSLVGPRPPLPREVDEYDLWHRRRLSMKPGITGLWQIQGRREENFDRWVELDLAYIDRWSIWLDVKIMARTIPAMFQGR
ncbi:MAG TPA: sugar transferase [Candidatus Limnocylindrales bacterium]|nr:sugar transferase [Candidatus Limnocylindrales bacterium]